MCIVVYLDSTKAKEEHCDLPGSQQCQARVREYRRSQAASGQPVTLHTSAWESVKPCTFCWKSRSGWLEVDLTILVICNAMRRWASACLQPRAPRTTCRSMECLAAWSTSHWSRKCLVWHAWAKSHLSPSPGIRCQMPVPHVCGKFLLSFDLFHVVRQELKCGTGAKRAHPPASRQDGHDDQCARFHGLQWNDRWLQNASGCHRSRCTIDHRHQNGHLHMCGHPQEVVAREQW